MDIPVRSICSSLRHHRLTAALLVLQIALTCAVLCNVLFSVQTRLQRMVVASGVDKSSLVTLSSESTDPAEKASTRIRADIRTLQAVPGVSQAVAIDGMPLDPGGESSYGICSQLDAWAAAMKTRSIQGSPDCISAAGIMASPGLLSALGGTLLFGRDFLPEEYWGDHASSVLMTRQLASRLYGRVDVTGKLLYQGTDHAWRIVGVIDEIIRSVPRGRSSDHDLMLWPHWPDQDPAYLLRTSPGQRQRVLGEAVAALIRSQPQRIVSARHVTTFTQSRRRFFRHDASMVSILLSATGGLLAVTAIGIGGLASFWVGRRRRQIGIRWAVGACRRDILAYFMLENILITGMGCLLGLAGAWLLSRGMMRIWELPALPWWYLPLGTSAMVLLGRLAVLGPALGAARISPMIAMRHG